MSLPSGHGSILSGIRCATFAGVFLVLVMGCASQLWDQLPEPAAEALADRRTGSLAAWEPLDGETDALDSLMFRGTPLLVSSEVELSIELELEPEDLRERESDFQTWNLSMDWIGKVGESIGAAAVVASDGYFLTAGHVIDEPPMDVIVFVRAGEGDPEVQRSPVRVVWAPDDPSSDLDIAIVHAEVGLLEAFTLAEEIAETGDQVITGGWPMLHLQSGSGRSRVSAGRILSHTERESAGGSPAFTIVRHDAPILHGDSGAPVLDRGGRLLGVNSKIIFDVSFWDWLAAFFGRPPSRINPERFVNTAIMPDPDWVREVIERDRRERAGAGEPRIRN